MPVGLNDYYFAWAPNWLAAITLIGAAIAIALILHAVLLHLVARFWSSRHVVANSLFQRTRGVARYGLILLALSAVMPAVPLNPEATHTAHSVFIAAIVLLIGWVVLLAANMTADYYLGHFQRDTADNLLARKAVTQVSVLKRIVDVIIVMVAVGFALMSFDTVRQVGMSLFASAGVAGLVAGVAARPIFANIFAGLQLALEQPIRIDDAVMVENEFGWIEEFGSSYVVIRLSDWRRMVVPLAYFLEKPFQNWTRTSGQILGSVFLYVNYGAPIDRVREIAVAIVKQSKLWDGKVVSLQVTDVKENTIELRILVSAANAGKSSDLRAEIREKLIAKLQREIPGVLPGKPIGNAAVSDAEVAPAQQVSVAH